MAKKTKKAHKLICKAKENVRALKSSLDSDLPACVPANEDTPMEATASPTAEKQGELMDFSQALCKHLNKGVNCKKLLRQIGNSPLLQCKACTNLDETDSRRKNVKKTKGNKSTKKGGTRSKNLLQSEDDWPTNTWVCLTCGYIGCGSISDSFLEGENKEIGVKVASEETLEKGHIWQHCHGVNHPCALLCSKRLLCRCFICRSTLLYNFSNSTNEENWADDWDGNLGLLVLQVWKVIKEKLVKKSDTVNGINNSANDDLINEKSANVLGVDKVDALVLSGRAVKGLINLGNTCFFNSVMQNLLALDVLRDHFTESNVEFEGSVTCSLRKLYMETSLKIQDKAGELDTSVSSSGIRKGRKGRMSLNICHGSISPGSLFGAISTKAPRFKGFQQQDSHELLRYLLDSLKTEELNTRKLRSNDLSKSPVERETDNSMDGAEQTFVDNIFGGRLSSTVCCCECGYSSVTYEPFLDLSLPIPTNESFKKSSFTPQGQNKHASLSAVENSSEKKKMRKDDRKGKKNHVKKNQVLYKNETTAEEEVVVHSQKFLSSASENITPSTTHGPTTKEDSENITPSLLHDKQFTEGPCQSVLGQSETMEQTEETDIQNIVHRCNGIMLDGAETMSLEQTCHPKAISQNGDNPHKNAACSSLENPISRGLHFDCQDRSVIHSNEMNCEIEQDVYNCLSAEDGIEVESTKDCETFIQLGTKIDQVKHLVESQLVTDYEHVDMDCNGVAQLLTAEISSFEKKEENHEAKNMELFQEKERHVFEAKKDVATEVSNRASREVTTNTVIPKSVEGCFTSFTNPELLSGENAWECQRCSITSAKDTTKDQINDNKNHEVSMQANIEQLSTLQGRQMQIGDSNFDSMMEEADAENNSIDRPYRPITRSCTRASERSRKDKVDFGKVDVNERKSVRSQGRKQRLEKVEPMETDTESKKVMRDATKQYRISKAPHVLTLHLKRFTQDLRGRLSKLSGHVTFQEKLDITPFLDPKHLGRESSTYRLIGVVEHSGSMRGGHYVAYVRGPEDENDEDSVNKNIRGQNTWYYISDTHVNKTSLSEVLTSEAYLLFYQRW